MPKIRNVVCFFGVITRRLEFICGRFEKVCLFHFHRQTYDDGTDGVSETSGNYPKESIQHTEHGESLKSKSRNVSKILTTNDEGRKKLY